MNIVKSFSVFILCSILLISSIAVSSLLDTSVSASEISGSESRQEAPAAVVGQITYVSDGTPISGVYIGGEGDFGEAFTFSNDTGHYTLNITEGEWFIQYNQTGLSGYSEEMIFAADEVKTKDVALNIDDVAPVINTFDLAVKNHISTINSALVEIDFVEEYYRTVDLSFNLIFERSDGMMSLMPITSYTNTDDHPPVHARDIELTAGPAPGQYTTEIDWNAATSGYKIFSKAGPKDGSIYDYGAFIPEDNRAGGPYSMLMGYYGKAGYESDAPGAIFLNNGVITNFYYMGQGDQGQVDLSDPTSTLQFAAFYYKTAENFQQGGGGPPEMGYKKLTDPIKVSDVILEPCDYAPSGDYLASIRVADWGSDEDDFKYYEVTVDTDSPVADTGGPYSTKETEEVLIDGRDSSDAHSDIINYTWTIKLPTSSEKIYGSHIYATFGVMGNYSIKLQVTDAGLNTAVKDSYIIVEDGTNPIAAQMPFIRIYEGDKVTFDGSASIDNVEIVNYTWTITLDNVVATLYGAEVTYTFEKIGNYSLKLTVYDSEENWHSTESWVDVVERPPSDTEPPSVIEEKMIPAKGADAVPLDIILEIPFSERLETSTLSFELVYEDSEGKKRGVEGYMIYNDELAKITFSPSSYLEYGTVYTLKLSVADLFENMLKDYQTSFTTEPKPLPPPPDTDDDDIPDPEDTDDDNDGLPDEWENKYGLDPLNATDADADPDGDGLTNLQEYSIGTNPTGKDSDGDGIPDDWEVKYNMNATDSTDAVKDDDSDGQSNLDEFQGGSDPLVPEQAALDKSEGSDDGGNWLYIILAVVIAIIAFLAVYMVFMRKPKQPDTASRPEELEEDIDNPQRRSRPVRVKKAVRPRTPGSSGNQLRK
jgi:hypothetical protein